MPRQRSWYLGDKEYRSGFERMVAEDLIAKDIPILYETDSWKYTIKEPGTECPECGIKPCQKTRSYTPDFHLPNGIIIEVKGRFTAADRKKHQAMRLQHPDLDIRMLFKTNNWITKAHKQRYGDWCDKNNIPWAVGKVIPEEWIHEK